MNALLYGSLFAACCLRAEGSIVAMAGSGVNDAPALAEADIGIAMGTGTEVAIQTAGITLVKGDLAGIARPQAQRNHDAQRPAESVFAFIYNAVFSTQLSAGC